MELISSSVGTGSKNIFKDVVTVQLLINGCIHLLKPLDLRSTQMERLAEKLLKQLRSSKKMW